jgi:hypothetical protein
LGDLKNLLKTLYQITVRKLRALSLMALGGRGHRRADPV